MIEQKIKQMCADVLQIPYLVQDCTSYFECVSKRLSIEMSA